MLRRKDALQTLEDEKAADTVSSCSILTALQLINFIRSRKTFCGNHLQKLRNHAITICLYVLFNQNVRMSKGTFF